jgi:hypothetical protein
MVKAKGNFLNQGVAFFGVFVVIKSAEGRGKTF